MSKHKADEPRSPRSGERDPKKDGPAVPVEKSITRDYIYCLEDGKPFKMMKRYIRAQYGLTPEQYREKWSLPDDYPMTAPSYAEEKRRYVKCVGLGDARLGGY